MNKLVTAEMVLSETDVELTLLGSLFEPGVFDKFAQAIKAEWFGDPLAKYLFEQCLKIHDVGNQLTMPTILAELPLDCGGMTRSALYASAVAAALPESCIGGLVRTLKDRWSRRSIIDMGEISSAAAVRHDADPYQIASDCLSALDVVMEVKDEKVGGSFRAASEALFDDIGNGAGMRGATTGLKALDSRLNGYRRGQLYVVAGRPGMGKSAFMCSSLRRTAMSGVGVAIFSLEMTKQEISARMLSDACDTDKAAHFGSILKDDFKPAQQDMMAEAYELMSHAPIHIDDSARMTFAQIAAKTRRLKIEMAAAGVPLGVVCIDHMGLVTPSDRYAGNKVAEAGEVSGRARALAKELDCCVVLLSQLSREVEKRDDKRPIMSDLRWSGEIEQDAHVIGFLYRDAYYLAQDVNADPMVVSDARSSMDFLIRKNRNGETSDVHLWCSIAHSSVKDVS